MWFGIIVTKKKAVKKERKEGDQEGDHEGAVYLANWQYACSSVSLFLRNSFSFWCMYAMAEKRQHRQNYSKDLVTIKLINIC